MSGGFCRPGEGTGYFDFALAGNEDVLRAYISDGVVAIASKRGILVLSCYQSVEEMPEFWFLKASVFLLILLQDVIED